MGLVSIANDIFVDAGQAEIGSLLVATIIIATIFSEIIGSYGTKHAVTRAGEVGVIKAEPEPHSRLVHEIDYSENNELS